MTAIQNNDQYIGQLLVRDGVINDQELVRGLEEQKKNRDFLCANLVRLGFATEEKIFSILSLQIGVPYISLKDVKIDLSVIKRVPGNFALGCKCLPLKESEGVFYIAMVDPLNVRAIEEIKGYLGVEKVKVFLAGDSELRGAISRYYGI